MQFSLNGREISTGTLPAHTTLLEYLRGSGLTGTKEGCAEGECGACAVVVVAPDGDRSRYRAVNSCLLLLSTLAGQEVYTVEGLARNGQLTEPQRAIAECGGSQCGYCTPGFVMSLFAEYYRPGRTGPCDPHAMGGNLCRCTGYRPLRDAALTLSTTPADAFQQRLSQPAPTFTAFSVDHPQARYERPASLADCLRLLAAHPEARPVAGATDLAVEMNLRGIRWPLLVGLEAIPELRTFSDTAEAVDIGAGLTMAEIEERWTTMPPAVREWISLFASPLIRNRATLGGNLGTASPVGDSAPLLLALDASVRIAGPSGIRIVPLRDFFRGYRQTSLQPGELLHSVRLPKPLPERLGFYKVTKRVLDDISTVAAAFALDFDAAGRIARARFAYGGVASTPVLIDAAEQTLLGQLWDGRAVQSVQRVISTSISPLSDHRGSAAYRLALTQSLIEKFWLTTQEVPAA